MSINTKQIDISIDCGADFSLDFKVRDSEDALVNLTGAVITAQLREYAESVDYYQFTAIHNGSGGEVTLSMPHEQTAQIGFSSGVYDVFIDFPDESRLKLLWGNATIKPAITKPVDGTVMILLSFTNEDAFPLNGLINRIYFSHSSGRLYQWNGFNYTQINRDITIEN